MGMGGQGLCWFEAGKLTVKFHCSLRGGARTGCPKCSHPDARGPPPSPRRPPGMATTPHSPALLPALCLPFPPNPCQAGVTCPPTKLSHPQPLVGPSWEGGIVGGGASALPDPHPRLLVLLIAALSCGGPLEEILVGVGGVCLPARPALRGGLMPAGWAGRTLGGHMGADLSPFTHLSLPQGLQLLPAGASG
ncbi:unnamed protein product [Rangifer tarandus platyrhynchus]|uniref:Uncharacterized protein n=1 Tax=Rangifer tarandus platyrhynchus TaxID=3082113 RepID=A0ABN8ZM63_RANTA|nr:unnamed protein product [Rangifer tarandus platyrhynchus]